MKKTAPRKPARAASTPRRKTAAEPKAPAEITEERVRAATQDALRRYPKTMKALAEN